MAKKTQSQLSQFPEPALSLFFFGDKRIAWFWLLIRLYVGWQWLEAGWTKVLSPVWVGPHAGGIIQKFVMGALAKTAGPHPDVSGWYAGFLKDIVLPNASTFSYMIAYGEVLVGIALLLGIFTGIAAFFGAFMNMNYLFAGTVSTNPLLFLCELFLILAWRVAGWIGGDRYVLPFLGTPWKPGELFSKK